jgi:hypothetical protein
MQALVWVKNKEWNNSDTEDIARGIQEGFLDHPHPSGIRFHIVDILPDEMFSLSDIQGETVMLFLEPLLASLAIAEDKIYFKRCVDNLLMKLPAHIKHCPQVRLFSKSTYMFILSLSCCFCVSKSILP